MPLLKRKRELPTFSPPKGRKRYTVIVQRDGSTALTRRTVTGKYLALLLAGVSLVLAFVVAVSVVALSNWHVKMRTGQLIAENRLLGHELNEIKTRLETITNSVDSLAGEEEMIRARVNLPPLGKDVRRAGIGGLMPLEGQVIGDERVEELLRSLDQIERELSVQRQSFNDIREKIVTNEQVLAHIPSIIPLKNGRFTDGFGYRRDPFTGQRRFHYGADFAAPLGTPVYATADGRVVKARRIAGMGNTVEIDHGYDYRTLYGHMRDFEVRRGQKVKRGDLIGFVGNTGRSTGPHLHYEIRVNNRPVNPLDYFYEGYELAGGRY